MLLDQQGAMKIRAAIPHRIDGHETTKLKLAFITVPTPRKRCSVPEPAVERSNVCPERRYFGFGSFEETACTLQQHRRGVGVINIVRCLNARLGPCVQSVGVCHGDSAVPPHRRRESSTAFLQTEPASPAGQAGRRGNEAEMFTCDDSCNGAVRCVLRSPLRLIS
jgi:hypothetical protein